MQQKVIIAIRDRYFFPYCNARALLLVEHKIHITGKLITKMVREELVNSSAKRKHVDIWEDCLVHP